MGRGKQIKKIFIANRGEIARRIAWSAKILGIPTAAVCEGEYPPQYLANLVGSFASVKNASAKDYLNADLILKLAKDLDCDSIHPGFGFLSENAAFAEKCEEAGFIWIGPQPKAMRQMASKADAFEIAQKHKVPCNIGLRNLDIKGDKQALDTAKKFAQKVGPPLLIKAALGGGGKGMRLVEDLSKLEEALQRCHSEAVSFFADGRLIVERYLAAPRHIEVQILADKHGNVQAIGDRDCSIQRRHQKIIEEAPAIFSKPETRKKLHAAAVQLAKAVQYDSAGTVEFLLDTKSKNEEFYFLEMNTRLQVEHTVSEEVYGLDLVAWQIRIAQGEKLNFEPALGMENRHSIEIRLYGENPKNNFLPSPGKVHYFAPWYGSGIRWEVGLDAVDEVSANFDPMVAKCVATGESRAQAIAKMRAALENTIFFGPANNKEYLVGIFEHPDFVDNRVHTHFISEQHEKLLAHLDKQKHEHQATVEKIVSFLKSHDFSKLKTSQATNTLSITQGAFGAHASSGSSKEELQIISTFSQNNAIFGCGITGLIGTAQSYFDFLLEDDPTLGRSIFIKIFGKTYDFVFAKKILQKEAMGSISENDIISPVPGKVIAIKVHASDMVEKDATLAIIESMKMEYEVKSNRAGKIVDLKFVPGDQVKAGDILVVLE